MLQRDYLPPLPKETQAGGEGGGWKNSLNDEIPKSPSHEKN